MSSLWDTDLEKGSQTYEVSISPSSSSDLKEDTFRNGINDPLAIPLPCPPPGEELQLLDYGDRLVSAYLAPRPHHPRFNNEYYDSKILQATRFRHLNIARIQHDIFRFQHVLTRPGGGSEENFARLSSLLHEHADAIRDWQFVANSTTKIDHGPRFMEMILSHFPEIPWDETTPPYRFAHLHDPIPRDSLITTLRSILPPSWRWTKAERKMRPEAYKLYLEGVPVEEPRYPSRMVSILGGAIISLASSILILIPTVILSFQLERTKSLITVAVAVTCFGFCLFVGARTTTSETFLATATYAAILVVFVGTNNPIHS